MKWRLGWMLVLAVGCVDRPSQTGFADDRPPLPRIATSSNEPAREMVGVDATKLLPREREAWWRLVSQLYAPCPDQAVSLSQCVEEKRPCVACAPMAQFLADRIHTGATSVDAEAASAVRFGQDVKAIEQRDSPFIGKKDAPVVITVFSDFQCPACQRGIPFLEKTAEAFPNDVKLVHKFYPLEKHPRAKAAAYAAIGAQKQGKYWEMEKKLFENSEALEDSDLEKYAREIGLDVAKWKKDAADPTSERTVERDRRDAEEAGLRSTPFILVNGRHFDLRLFKYDELEPWIRTELAMRNAANPR